MDDQPTNFSELINWTPFSLSWEPSGAVIDWCYLGEARFTDPFFDQTVTRLQQMPGPQQRQRRTPAAILDELEKFRPGVSPTGFIFHASRCGSTLLAQMLATLPENIVLSEPFILHTVIQARRRPPALGANLTEQEHMRLLRGLVSAMARPRHENERHCFIKFKAAEILDVPLVRSVFPDVPWVYLYRDPLEIMASYLGFAASTLPPGLARAGLIDGDPSEIDQLSAPEFWSRVLAANFSAAARFHEPGRSLLLNYNQLPEAVLERLPGFFGLTFSAEQLQCMRAATLRDAKQPDRSFTPDSERKRQAISEEARALVETVVMPHYRRLESMRIAELG